MTFARRVSSVIALSLVSSLLSCMSWAPGWRLTGAPGAAGDTGALRSRAEALVIEADTEEKVRTIVGLYEEILRCDPLDYDALCKLGQYHCLLGAAYTPSRAEKKREYLLAIQSCERAMATNPQFRALVEKGAGVDEACRVLTISEMDAMFFWSMAISYMFKECQSGAGRIVNFSWMKRCRAVMERMLDLAPEWREGAVYFSWGIYYLGLPEAVGGDMKKSAEFLDKASRVGPKSLLHRWGRAKYYDVKVGDAKAFREDLQWVLDQDPRQSENPTYPWNAYLQRDARAMLERARSLPLKKAAVT